MLYESLKIIIRKYDSLQWYEFLMRYLLFSNNGLDKECIF